MKTKKTIIYLFAIAIIATLFTSCAKDGAMGPAGTNGATGASGPTGATGSTGPVYYGNMMGFVKKYDQYGNLITTGLSGTTVQLSGTATKTTSTDSTGKYVFDSLPTGNYSFAYSAANFGSNQVQDFLYLGDSTALRGITSISAIPNFNVANLAIKDTVINTDSSIFVTGTMNATDNVARTVMVFIGSTSGTSSSPANYIIAIPKTVNALATTFTITIPIATIYDAGFTIGTTAYFAAYGINSLYGSSSEYIDYTTGRTVYTAVSGSSAIGSIVVQ
jgi:hypothetical protein